MPGGSHTPVAVVGAGGFIGSALCRSLESGGGTVVRLTRQTPVLRADGRLDARLEEASTIFWAAARINPTIAAEHPELVEEDLNDFSTFLDVLHDARPTTRVVLLSSGGTVYGSASRPPHSESTPPQPASAFGLAKLRLEQTLHHHDIPSVVVRIANAYGPGQPAAAGQGVIGHWLRAVRDGRAVTVFGPLDTTRDYVFIDDLVGLLRRVADGDGVPALVNAGSGRPTTLATVVEVVQDVVGPLRLVLDQQEARSFDIPASWLDVSLAWRSLGWQATTDLSAGVSAMWRWLTREPPGTAR